MLFCIGGFFVLYLEAVFYSLKVCASWKKMNTVQKYYKISEPPNFTLQSYVKPILTFRLSQLNKKSRRVAGEKTIFCKMFLCVF